MSATHRRGRGDRRGRRTWSARAGRASRRALSPATALAGVLLLTAAGPGVTLAPTARGAAPARGGAAESAHANASGDGVGDGVGALAPQDASTPGRVVTVEWTRSAPEFGIPATVLDSYRRAEAAMATTAPGCHLTWPLLAGIGKVESGHAHNGDVAPNGDVLHPILGPVLSGSGGNAAVPNSSAGQWGQAGQWARAVGPMQFLPSTWQRWASDGNGDGVANPENTYDASLAAARYLCSGNGDLATSTGLTNAIFSYNHSAQYVDLVLQWMRVYQAGGVPVADQPGWFDLTDFAPPPSSGQDEEVAPAPPAPAAPQTQQGPRPAPAPVPAPPPTRRPAPPPAAPGPAPTGGPTLPVVGPTGPVLATVTSVVGSVVPPSVVQGLVGPLLP